MRLSTYLRFCALLALVVFASAQPRSRREREAEQAAAEQAAAAAAANPPPMTWAKPDAPPPVAAAPAPADAKKAAAPAPAPGKAAAEPKPSKDAPKGAVKGFIRVSGNKFVDEKCGDFIPIGWNCEFFGKRRGVVERGAIRWQKLRGRGERGRIGTGCRVFLPLHFHRWR